MTASVSAFGLRLMPEQGVAIEFDRSDRAPKYELRLIIHTKILRLCCSAEFWLKQFNPALSLVVWTLKREVRAIRGCLGAYRR